MRRPPATVCPICLVWYAVELRRPGTRCDDLSHGQATNCVGRVIPESEFRQAEWYTLTHRNGQLVESEGRHPYVLSTDTP